MRWFLFARLGPTTVNIAFTNTTGHTTVVNSDESNASRLPGAELVEPAEWGEVTHEP